MEDIEVLFGYAQTIAAALFRAVVKGRLSVDDRRSIIYYAELISTKIKEMGP